MAGTTLARELASASASHLEFAIATEADDADLRRLLRENPMAGRVSLSLEREPNFFASFCGAEQQTIVARARGRLACAGWCVFQERFVNGTPRRVGYLGGLRLDRHFAGRFDLVRRGYQFFHKLQSEQPADFYFTSIAADNGRAQRFLERGLSGLPHYAPIADFVTLLMPVTCSYEADFAVEFASHPLPRVGCSGGKLDHLVPCLRHDLPLESFIDVEVHGQTAQAALWDQRAFKQTVVRSYSRMVRLARPFLNFAAQAIGKPRLPAIGKPLAHAFVTHLVAAPTAERAVVALLSQLRQHARALGLDFLTLGFDARDPRLTIVRRAFRCREYHSRLYSVNWDDMPAVALDDRLCSPEVALL